MAVADDATSDDPDPPPPRAPGFLWKSLFAEKPPSLSPSSSPSFLPDGTPVVHAPPSVLLNASQAWSGYLMCHFLGEPPSPAKIFSDLNPIWGRKGAITVRKFSQGLVFVPSASHRRWILEAGLWSSGNVAFTVSEWSATPTFSPAKLTSAPTVLTLRDVPPQLWSQSGVEIIAGGVAELIPHARASLPLLSLGTARIRAIVPLGPVLPTIVIVQDSKGDSVRVSVEYGRLPAHCPTCLVYGHSKLRCPSKRSPPPHPSSKINSSENLESQNSGKESPEDLPLRSPQSMPVQSNLSVQSEDGAEKLGQHSSSLHGLLQAKSPLTSPKAHKPNPESNSSSSPSEQHNDPINPIISASDPRSISTLRPPFPTNSSPHALLDNSGHPLPYSSTKTEPDHQHHMNNHSSPQASVSSIANQSDITSLMTQTKADLSEIFSTPRKPPPVNTHIYFSTPSTTSIPNLASPPSVSIPEPQIQVNSTTTISTKKKKKLPSYLRNLGAT